MLPEPFFQFTGQPNASLENMTCVYPNMPVQHVPPDMPIHGIPQHLAYPMHQLPHPMHSMSPGYSPGYMTQPMPAFVPPNNHYTTQPHRQSMTLMSNNPVAIFASEAASQTSTPSRYNTPHDQQTPLLPTPQSNAAFSTFDMGMPSFCSSPVDSQQESTRVPKVTSSSPLQIDTTVGRVGEAVFKNDPRHRPIGAAPGPIPATPLEVHFDDEGVQWIAFQYSRDRVKQAYRIRCDVDSVSSAALGIAFQRANCVYPRAFVDRSVYTGNRYEYESECNSIGWALAELNPALQGKRGLIQRAVDSWRNSNQDEKMQSRRMRRQTRNKSKTGRGVSKRSTSTSTSAVSKRDASRAPSRSATSHSQRLGSTVPSSVHDNNPQLQIQGVGDMAQTPLPPSQHATPSQHTIPAVHTLPSQSDLYEHYQRYATLPSGPMTIPDSSNLQIPCNDGTNLIQLPESFYNFQEVLPNVITSIQHALDHNNNNHNLNDDSNI